MAFESYFMYEQILTQFWKWLNQKRFVTRKISAFDYRHLNMNNVQDMKVSLLPMCVSNIIFSVKYIIDQNLPFFEQNYHWINPEPEQN